MWGKHKMKSNISVLFGIWPGLILRQKTGKSKSINQNLTVFNTLRTGSFKLFKRPFLEFLTILTL